MRKHYYPLVRGCGLHLHHLKNGHILSGDYRRSLSHQPHAPIVRGRGIEKVVMKAVSTPQQALRAASRKVMRPLKFKF